MHGKSIAWVRDRCRLQGAYRPLLYAVATHAGKHYADCTASAATLARASGLSTRHVKRLLPDLVAMGVLEQLDPGAGRRAACYRIAPPLWVEGEASAAGLVEGEATAAGVVEGDVSLGSSGDTRSPQRSLADALGLRSGDIGNPVVVTLPIRSGDTIYGVSSEDGSQEKYVEEKSFEDKNTPHSRSLASARSNAGRAQAPDDAEPPPVPESVKQELERRGLRQTTKPPRSRSTDPPVRSREEQLAILERMAAEDAAKAGAAAAHAQPATTQFGVGTPPLDVDAVPDGSGQGGGPVMRHDSGDGGVDPPG
jgi:hypothetical protein